MENPIKMDDLGVPLFLETPIFAWSFQYTTGRNGGQFLKLRSNVWVVLFRNHRLNKWRCDICNSLEFLDICEEYGEAGHISSTLFETFVVQKLIICKSIITCGCRFLRWCRITVTFDSGSSWFVSQLAVYLCSRWTRWQWFPKAKRLNSWWVLPWFQNFLVYQTHYSPLENCPL